MINSRILNMTIPATTTCNSNILDVLNSKMNGNKKQLNMYSQNMANRRTTVNRTYRSFADVVVAVTLLITTLE
jgi:flagellar basal body rod protein FlgC